jgi:Reverse transcriptase (RNA-dependent DNA polymerase)
MNVIFIENEPFYKHIQNSIQGETENIIRDKLNFDFLAFESKSGDSMCNFDVDCERNVDYENERNVEINDQFKSVGGMHQITELEPNLQAATSVEDHDTEGEIIQSDNPAPQQPEALGEGSKVSSLETVFKLPPRKNRGQPPKRYVPEDDTSIERYPIAKYTTIGHLSEPLKGFVNQLSSIVVPRTLEEAVKDKKWINAMNMEMDALKRNNTWEIIDLPIEKKAVGCKWVYTIKYDAQGRIERYKIRLVAKGYTQTYDIDFQETFSPVAKLSSVRVILSIAANFE